MQSADANKQGLRQRAKIRHLAPVLALLLSFFAGRSVLAQEYGVALYSVDNKQEQLIRELELPGKKVSEEAAFGFIRDIVPRLQEKGYLAASVDSFHIGTDVYKAFVYLGQSFRWGKISFDSIPESILVQSGVSRERWEGRPLNPAQISRVSDRLLQWAENNGYPFARVWLEAGGLEGAEITGRFLMDRGALQTLDTVIISGDVKVSRGYLLRYLDLKQGEVYQEKKIRGIGNRIMELPFLQEGGPASVSFDPGGATLYLNLKERRANQLNAIVGLLPNSVETGKFLLTVDALFAFQNILSRGESISLSYQNLQYRSPRLKLDLVYPYLFNSPVGVDLHFDLFRKDTAFRRTSLQAGFRYALSATDYLRVFYQNQSNRVITVDTALVRQTRRLPEDVDVTANGLGLELGMNHTDYRFNPRRGWEWRIASVGLLRSVRESDVITAMRDTGGFEYRDLYDTLKQRRNQYQINGNIAAYLPLGKSLVLKSAYAGGWISGNNLFHNELYQIGGFRLLRGFDEQGLFTPHYHVLSAELRVLLDRNSYFYAFTDNGYVAMLRDFREQSDFYHGFGIGTTLEARSGLFSISYALGKYPGLPLQFRQSRVHFGYVAYF